MNFVVYFKIKNLHLSVISFLKARNHNCRKKRKKDNGNCGNLSTNVSKIV